MRIKLAAVFAVLLIVMGGIFIYTVSAQEEVALPIIMYHSVVREGLPVGDYVTGEGTFFSDMLWLKENGYETVVVQDLVDYTNGGELPEKPIMITFDDGFLNNLTICGPILKENNMRAVLSVVGAYSDNEANSDVRSDNYSYLTWEEISRAKESGVFEIQNHSYNLHGGNGRQGAKKLDGESTLAFKVEIMEDIGKMQYLLKVNSKIDAACFTYPFGYFDPDSKEAIRECGFLSSMICYEKINRITRDGECLYNLGRFNRSGLLSTAEFFKKCGLIIAS